jgi:hypothetical protein
MNRHLAFSFTPNGETIISGGSYGVVAAYDLVGRRLGDFVGHVQNGKDAASRIGLRA